MNVKPTQNKTAHEEGKIQKLILVLAHNEGIHLKF